MAVEQHAEVLKGGVWQRRIPSWRDLAAVVSVLGTVILLGAGASQMVTPFVVAHRPAISLSPAALPFYALRTVMRMLAAPLLSPTATWETQHEVPVNGIEGIPYPRPAPGQALSRPPLRDSACGSLRTGRPSLPCLARRLAGCRGLD
jgi:hypothetical protein